MLVGTGDAQALAHDAPTLVDFSAKETVLGDVDTLQIIHELYTEGVDALLPPGLHPTSPGVVTWLVQRVGESPWGPFRLAQCRIECRSGLRPRGFLRRGILEGSDEAREALAAQWGYRMAPGDVALDRGYHAITAHVSLKGREVLDASLEEPRLLRTSDVFYVANMNLAHTPNGLRLVQVDPEWEIDRAERGDVVLGHFDAEAWHAPGAVPSSPVTATFTHGSMTLPAIRYVCETDVLAFQGSERVG